MGKWASEEAKYDSALELGNFGSAHKKITAFKRGTKTWAENTLC